MADSQVQYKNEGVALVLAAVLGIIGLCGIGHIYAGRLSRGILILLASLVTGALVVFMWIIIVPVIIHIGLVIWTIFDARNVCREYNTTLSDTGQPPW